MVPGASVNLSPSRVSNSNVPLRVITYWRTGARCQSRFEPAGLSSKLTSVACQDWDRCAVPSSFGAPECPFRSATRRRRRYTAGSAETPSVPPRLEHSEHCGLPRSLEDTRVEMSDANLRKDQDEGNRQVDPYDRYPDY